MGEEQKKKNQQKPRNIFNTNSSSTDERITQNPPFPSSPTPQTNNVVRSALRPHPRRPPANHRPNIGALTNILPVRAAHAKVVFAHCRLPPPRHKPTRQHGSVDIPRERQRRGSLCAAEFQVSRCHWAGEGERHVQGGQ